MKKNVATRKRKKLSPSWVTDSGFEVRPTQRPPAEPRALKDYTILISARKVGDIMSWPPVAAKA